MDPHTITASSLQSWVPLSSSPMCPVCMYVLDSSHISYLYTCHMIDWLTTCYMHMTVGCVHACMWRCKPVWCCLAHACMNGSYWSWCTQMLCRKCGSIQHTRRVDFRACRLGLQVSISVLAAAVTDKWRDIYEFMSWTSIMMSLICFDGIAMAA